MLRNKGGELRIYLEHFKKTKDQNPDKVIDDYVSAILCSFMINPDLILWIEMLIIMEFGMLYGEK